MFEILLYKNSAEKHRIDKSYFLEYLITTSGTLRESTSIINPQITIAINFYTDIIKSDTIQDIIDSDSFLIVDNDVPVTIYDIIENFDCNYAYIPAFKRYYYITNIVSESNSLWRLYMEVDVLMSFKDKIFNTKAFIGRNEYKYNVFLPDNKLPVKVGNAIRILDAYDSDNIISSYGELARNNYEMSSNRCIALQITGIGKINQSNYEGYNQTVGSNVNSFNMLYFMSVTVFNQFITKLIYNSSSVQWLFQDPQDSLVSIKLLPIKLKNYIDFQIYFNYDEYGTEQHLAIEDTHYIRIGGDLASAAFDITGIGYATIVPSNVPLKIFMGRITTLLLSNDESSFLMFEPYSNSQLFLPYYGFCDIDINLYLYRLGSDYRLEIKIYYLIDCVTGICTAILLNHDDVVCQTFEFDISINIPIGNTNSNEIMRNQFLAALKLGQGVVSLGLSAYGSMSANAEEAGHTYKSGDASKIIANDYKIRAKSELLKYDTASKAVNIASNFTVDMIKAGQLKLQCGTSNSSITKGFNIKDMSRNGDVTPYLIIKRNELLYTTSNDKKSYAHLVGRPCQELGNIGDYNGYTEVSGVHLEGFNTAMKEEVEEIENLLKSGVLLPEP